MTIPARRIRAARSPARVLLLEADALDSLHTESCLNDLGIDDVRLARSVRQAMSLIDETHFDLALLDFDFDGHETSFSVAERLCAADVPLVVTASLGKVRLPRWCARSRIVRKPLAFEDLERAISQH